MLVFLLYIKKSIFNYDILLCFKEAIAGPKLTGEITSKPSIQCPQGNQLATLILTNHLKGPIGQHIRAFWRVLYEVYLEWLSVANAKGDRKENKRPNTWQIQKGKLIVEKRVVKHRLKEALIQDLLNDIKKIILVFSRAESQRKHRKRSQQFRRPFYNNTKAFAKKLFTEIKSSKFDVPEEELDNNQRLTYYDAKKDIPIPSMNDLPSPQPSEFLINDSGLKLKEIREFVHKSCVGGAP